MSKKMSDKTAFWLTPPTSWLRHSKTYDTQVWTNARKLIHFGLIKSGTIFHIHTRLFMCECTYAYTYIHT